MLPLLFLLLAVSVFAADDPKLRIYELGKLGADKLSDLPARYAEAMAKGYTAEMPNPVFRLSDLVFLPEGRRERLDLYVSHGRDFKVRRPGVLFIHGGGFTKGDKAEYRSASVSADLARAGYVVVSCNYVLGAKDQPGVWPRNIADCRDAVRWMRANADALGLDPERIAVAGGSAGGYLALMVGLSDDKTGPGGYSQAKHSAKVSAVIDMYGVVNFSKHGKGQVPGASAAEQAAVYGLDREACPGPIVARWNLQAGRAYEEARADYFPFDRLVEEDEPTRAAVANLAARAAARGRGVFVTINNKAEGSAPLSVLRLAEVITAAIQLMAAAHATAHTEHI